MPAPDLMEEEEDNLQGVLQVFRVFKLARILKLARCDDTDSVLSIVNPKHDRKC